MHYNVENMFLPLRQDFYSKSRHASPQNSSQIYAYAYTSWHETILGSNFCLVDLTKSLRLGPILLLGNFVTYVHGSIFSDPIRGADHEQNTDPTHPLPTHDDSKYWIFKMQYKHC